LLSVLLGLGLSQIAVVLSPLSLRARFANKPCVPPCGFGHIPRAVIFFFPSPWGKTLFSTLPLSPCRSPPRSRIVVLFYLSLPPLGMVASPSPGAATDSFLFFFFQIAPPPLCINLPGSSPLCETWFFILSPPLFPAQAPMYTLSSSALCYLFALLERVPGTRLLSFPPPAVVFPKPQYLLTFSPLGVCLPPASSLLPTFYFFPSPSNRTIVASSPPFILPT